MLAYASRTSSGEIIVVAAVGASCGKAGRVAEQDPQGHLLLRMFLEDAVDVKVGQVSGDGLVQVHQSILSGEHGGGGGKGFGHGLD